MRTDAADSPRRDGLVAASAATAILALTGAGCGSSTTPPTPAAGAAATHHAMASRARHHTRHRTGKGRAWCGAALWPERSAGVQLPVHPGLARTRPAASAIGAPCG